ncbi:hypothetical protein [Nostocoides australiense]
MSRTPRASWRTPSDVEQKPDLRHTAEPAPGGTGSPDQTDGTGSPDQTGNTDGSVYRWLWSALLGPTPKGHILNWCGPIAFTIIGGLMRAWQLGRPGSIVFDVFFKPETQGGTGACTEKGSSCIETVNSIGTLTIPKSAWQARGWLPGWR